MIRGMLRFFVIWHTLVKFGLEKLIPPTPFQFVVTFLTYLMPVAWVRKIEGPTPVRLKNALESLGPIYVKFGQTISTRPDLLSSDMAQEMAKLQDNVTPFSSDIAIKIIEKKLNQSVDTAFARFDSDVLASASIAQVHSAQLHSGEEVIVKVLRPNIERTIRNDMMLMKLFAKFIHVISKEVRRMRLPEVMEEFDKTIFNELDLMQEASNGAKLRQNFIDSDLLYVPIIYWDYCSKQVLVMERISGVPIGDIETLNKNNVNMKKLAANGVTIFFTQVFYHQYFHADMHPGNVFVDITDPENPKYIAIDFGIMASLNDEDQYYLAANFLAFFNRDYRRVAQLHIDSGWIPNTVKVTDFESAIRKACEPIFGKPIKDISFAQFLITLFDTARRYDMSIQPQLVLLQKTFFNIEGLGRVLYPNLDLWDTGKPILEKWMKDQFSPKKIVKTFQSRAGEYYKAIEDFPLLVDKHLRHQENNSNKQQSRLIEGIVLGFLIFTAFQPTLWGEPYSRYILVASALIFAWRLWRK